MTPEQKSKLIKVLIGAAVAAGVAALGYLTAHLQDVFSAVPFGLAAGLLAGGVSKI